jgi:hypothetical protein
LKMVAGFLLTLCATSDRTAWLPWSGSRTLLLRFGAEGRLLDWRALGTADE